MHRSKAENERQYQVIDQMLTMHSSYRDRMERRAFFLNTSLIGFSLFLTVFAFIGDDLLRVLGFDPELTRFALGLVAATLLILSITEYRVDWRSSAHGHGKAASLLSDLKAEYRKCHTTAAEKEIEMHSRLTEKYNITMNNLPKIPDRWFNTLKAEHVFKVLLSKRISQSPKTWPWLILIQLRVTGIKEALGFGKGGDEG